MAEIGSGALIVGSIVKGATSALVTKYVAEIVNPFLRGVVESRAQATIKSNLFRYIKSVEYRTRYLPSLAISGSFLLEDVYEPLTIRNDTEGTSFKIDVYPRDLLSHCRCIAITDDAGMGKSTLAKFIVRAAIKENKNIPLLVELRRLRSGDSIVEALCADLVKDSSLSTAGRALIGLFESGNFIFVFDGYDEVDDHIRGKITDEINYLSSRFQFCYFIVTSRKEYGSALFPEFSHFEISKLDKIQAYALLKRYDGEKGLVKGLISKIQEAEVDEFLGNPLLVTLLYRAFDYRPTIPPKRSTFFRQVYEALFQDHDLSKGGSFERRKQCGLDIDDFHKVLRALGFVTFKSGRVSYTAEEFSGHLTQAASRAAVDVEAGKIKTDLVRAVPLMSKDGTDYKWSHKSFQEYFAAHHISIDLAAKKSDIIKKLFLSEEILRYREVLRFIGELDLPLVRATCIEPHIKQFVDGAKNDLDLSVNFLLGGCDLYYVGGLKGSVSDYRKLISDALKDDFGIDISNGSSRMIYSHFGGYAIVSCINVVGLRSVMLPILDPLVYKSYSGKNHIIGFQTLQSLFGSDRVFLNIALKNRSLRLLDNSILSLFRSVSRIPSVTLAGYESLLNQKNRFDGLSDCRDLEGF